MDDNARHIFSGRQISGKDMFKSHRTDNTKKLLAECNIEVAVIPDEGTSLVQPLDVEGVAFSVFVRDGKTTRAGPVDSRLNNAFKLCKWAQNEIAVVPDFHKRILFSDEAHFWLNGYVNKQNYRIWSEPNLQVYVETPLHPEKLTVWCALWAGGIIGPYFFKNDEGHNVTVNGDR
ncbi:uncharacterized protein TNCV_2196641 [Trichonephila clavipes]|nr:uncharacterized protein TNCV_2196641 [Trichonephila clavipes]